MCGRAVGYAVEFRIVRLIFLEHIVAVRSILAMAMIAFFMCPPLFQCEVTAADFRKLLGLNGAQSALNKQGLDIGPARLILVVFLFPALSLF